MVDSIKGPGSLPPVSQAKTPQAGDKKKAEGTAAAAKTDEVVISQEALSLRQIDKIVQDTKDLLDETDFPLGLNPSFAVDAVS